MYLKLYLLLFLLFAFKTSNAFQKVQESDVQHLKQQLEKIQNSKKELREYYWEIKDSTTFQNILDSLEHSGLQSDVIKQKQDSLISSFFEYKLALERLGKEEELLNEELKRLLKEQNVTILPEEIELLSNPIDQAGSWRGSGNPTVVNGSSIKQSLPVSGWPAPPVSPQPLHKGTANASDQAKKLAVESAKEFFTHNQSQLKQARVALDKQKARFGSRDSLNNKSTSFFLGDALKGKPWQERTLIGATWKLLKQEQYLVDIGPYIGWRLTDRYTVGTGFQYRLNVDLEEKPWVSASDKVFGYNLYADIELFKGFFGRMQFDNLSTQVPRKDNLGQVEQYRREWVKGFSLGAGRNYTFYKYVRGFAVIQYNFLHQHTFTPYLRPVQAKMGFYINGKHLAKPGKRN